MNNLNVLLLDDEKAIHDLFKSYFKGIYEIYSAHTYNEAINLFESRPRGFFKLFIIDISLPGHKNGLDFIEEYLDSCKVIVLSGYLESYITDILIEMEIFAAFKKPVDMGELFISMNSIIRCE